MIRLRSTTAAIAAVALILGCDDGRPGSSGDDGGDADARAVYARQMIFIAADATGAAVLDFTAADVGSAVRRTARAWAEAGSGWTPLYDLAWEGVPVRRPWLLVPNGPIRVRVGLGEEVEAIAVRERDTDLAALETGDLIAEWAPYRTAQVILREATLALGGEPMRGWLVDARFGVTPQAAIPETTEGFAPNGSEPPPLVAPAAELAQDDSAAASDSTPATTPPAAPQQVSPQTTRSAMRVRAVRGVLVGPDGETLVIAETETGLGGWLWNDGEETTLPILTLTSSSGEREGWVLEAGGNTTLTGSLTVMDEEPLPVSPRIVRGTVVVRGDSLEMHGVLRPGDAVN